MRSARLVCAFWLASCAPSPNETPDFGIVPEELQSGLAFVTEETRALQTDDFSNPGYLWVEKGKELFAACRECHDKPQGDFHNTAAKFPLIHERTGRLTNLQGQINICRTEHQKKDAFGYESEEMLGLVSYIKNLSLNQTLNYEITGELLPSFEAGKSYFYKRRGQLNLSCAQCHDENWGKKMRGDTVSQGHINGFPAFRNDWQTLGSAHRRFQACNIGVRAQTSGLGSKDYLNLEVYLKARGAGLENETPSIRR